MENDKDDKEGKGRKIKIYGGKRINCIIPSLTVKNFLHSLTKYCERLMIKYNLPEEIIITVPENNLVSVCMTIVNHHTNLLMV